MRTRRELANAIRALAMDAVERAHSGHPGMPMGMADIAEVLWNDFLRHNPANPLWCNRDRFLLSNGLSSEWDASDKTPRAMAYRKEILQHDRVEG